MFQKNLKIYYSNDLIKYLCLDDLNSSKIDINPLSEMEFSSTTNTKLSESPLHKIKTSVTQYSEPLFQTISSLKQHVDSIPNTLRVKEIID